MKRMMLFLTTTMLATSAHAQTSSFSAEADGTPQPVPMLVREDLQRTEGRAEITVTPDAITEGSQNFLRSDDWGFWLYRNRLHMQFYTTEGERHLVRIEDSANSPRPGAEAVAGQPLEFELSWSSAGLGVFASGELRAYLEGDFREPTNLVYGASTSGGGPFVGALTVDVFAEPAVYDPCTNYPDWGTDAVWDAQGTRLHAAELIPQPTCQTPVDPDPVDVVNGVATTDLSWTPPTENEDGSVLLQGEIEGYHLFWGEQSRVGRCGDYPDFSVETQCYPNSVFVEGGGATAHQLTFGVDRDTTVFFTAATSAVNDDGESLVSRFSNEVGKRFEVSIEDVPVSEPSPPVNVTVFIDVSCEVVGEDKTCEVEVIDVQ